MKIRFYSKTSIRLVNTMANSLFYQKPRIEYSSVRSFCTGRFDQKSRGVLFLEKKGPCQECPGCRRNWFPQKVNNSRNSDKQKPFSEKVREAK